MGMTLSRPGAEQREPPCVGMAVSPMLMLGLRLDIHVIPFFTFLRRQGACAWLAMS